MIIESVVDIKTIRNDIRHRERDKRREITPKKEIRIKRFSTFHCQTGIYTVPKAVNCVEYLYKIP